MEHPSADGDHGGPAVLQLLELDFLGHVEVEGVPAQIAGEAAGLEAGRNGLVLGELAVLVRQLVDLGDGDQGEHLGEAPGGDVPHGLEGGHGGEVGELDALGHGEVVVGADFVEGEAGPVDAVPDGGKHGGPAVLDLGVAEPGDGLVRSEVGEAEGIPLLAELDGVGLGEDGLAVRRRGELSARHRRLLLRRGRLRGGGLEALSQFGALL